jgi:hypothetical protein
MGDTNIPEVKRLYTLRRGGEDYYAIDMIDNGTHKMTFISVLKPDFNILEPLELYDRDKKNEYPWTHGRINVGEMLVNEILTSLERVLADTPGIDKEKYKEVIAPLSNPIFREVKDCFPNMTVENATYAPPDYVKIISTLEADFNKKFGQWLIEKEAKALEQLEQKKNG